MITDGDLTLAESGAIIDYIVAKYGDGRLSLGVDDPDFATYLYWFHFANGSLMPSLMMKMGGGPLAEAIRARVDRGLGALDHRLSTATWLAGDQFTIADVMTAFPLTTMRLFVPIDLSPYPNILAYLQRLGARPAFRRAMAKADPEARDQADLRRLKS